MIFRNSDTRYFKRVAVDGARWLGVDDLGRARAFLLAGLLVTLLLAAFAFAPVWRLYGWLPEDRLHSDRLRVTHSLSTRWRAQAPEILFIGGSQIRELLPDDEFMSGRFSQRCGRTVTVFNATSSAQLPESSWSLIETFGAQGPALVVTGVNLWRSAASRAQAARLSRALLPLPRPSDAVGADDALPLRASQRLAGRMGVVFADALAVVRSQPADASRDSFDGAHNQYRGAGWSTTEKIIDGQYQLRMALAAPARTLRANVAIYRHLAEFVHARGGDTLFLLPPHSPELQRSLDELEPEFSESARHLDYAGGLLDLRAAGALTSNQFFDSVHLRADGRRQFWPILEQALAERLADCQPAVQ